MATSVIKYSGFLKYSDFQNFVEITGNNQTNTLYSGSFGAGLYVFCINLAWDSSTVTPTIVLNNNSDNVNLVVNSAQSVCISYPLQIFSPKQYKIYAYHSTSTSKNIIRCSIQILQL